MLAAGYNPIAAVVPYGSAVNTAATDLPPSSVSTDSSGQPSELILC